MKKIYKSFLSALMAFTLAMVQPLSALASDSGSLTSDQLSTLLDGMDSIVLQLEEIGLNDSEINELFQLSPRENSFYTSIQVNSISYSGSFAKSYSDRMNNNSVSTCSSYNGNPPSSSEIQRQRIENIYAVGLKYFTSNYYQGAKSNGQDFGNYLAYLYLSHYVDGPGRAPTANDLPYIISTDDIQAYNTFMTSANLTSWATALAGFGSAIFSDIDYANSLNSINTVDNEILQCIQTIGNFSINGYNSESALATISPLVLNALTDNYTGASNDEELCQIIINSVSSELESLDFYNNYDENITNTIINILATTFITIVCESISLMGFCVSVIPLYVYEATGLLGTAVLVTLQYSFSGRYAIRSGIYLGL